MIWLEVLLVGFLCGLVPVGAFCARRAGVEGFANLTPFSLWKFGAHRAALVCAVILFMLPLLAIGLGRTLTINLEAAFLAGAVATWVNTLKNGGKRASLAPFAGYLAAAGWPALPVAWGVFFWVFYFSRKPRLACAWAALAALPALFLLAARPTAALYAVPTVLLIAWKERATLLQPMDEPRYT